MIAFYVLLALAFACLVYDAHKDSGWWKVAVGLTVFAVASLIPWERWVLAGRVMAAVGIYGGLVLGLLCLAVLLAAVPGRRG